REKVFLRELLASADYADAKARLPLCLGKTIGGEPVVPAIRRCGIRARSTITGSGKSVAINTMILSLMYRLPPEECRLIMIDPKMLELSVYDGIPHLLTPVVTDPKKAIVALKWAVREMEERYRKMSKLGVRNIDGYNARVAEAKAKGETLTRTVHTGYDKESGEAIYEKEELELDALPFIVAAERTEILVIDPPDTMDGEPGAGAEIAASLSRHGANVSVATVKSEGSSMEDVIQDRLTETGADMLVLGAYSHSWLRRLVFGGVTNSVLRAGAVAAFLSR
ncbi:MAG: hypothetical protein F9K43_21995, partial [Bauldia sp.]